MKQLRSIILPLTDCLLIFLASACTPPSPQAQRQLIAADAMIVINPDSALKILDMVDADLMNREQTAHHALLRTKAFDKNYAPLPPDSLIALAAEYYSGHGDSLEVQALYYLGLTMSYAGKSDSALYTLHSAHAKAVETSDNYYAGLSARELSFVYINNNLPTEQLKWSRKAKKRLTDAGKPTHAAWIDIDIMHSLIFTGKLDEARSFWDSIDTETYTTSRNFRHHMLINRIELANQLHNMDDIAFCYDSLIRDGYRLSAHDYCRLAQVDIDAENFDKATSLLKAADRIAVRSIDSMHINKLNSIILYNKGDYKGAAKAAMNAYYGMANSTDKILLNPPNSLLLENLSLRNEYLRAINNQQNTQIVALFLICIISVILGIATALYLRTKKRIKRLETEQLVSRLKILQQEIDNKEIELNKRTDQTERLRLLQQEIAEKEIELNKRAGQTDNAWKKYNMQEQKNKEQLKTIKGLYDGIKEILSSHLSLLDNICSSYYLATESNPHTELPKHAIKQIIAEITSEETGKQIMHIIDVHDNNWMTRFMQSYPTLNEKQYRLAAYIYCGFSPQAIASLTGKVNINMVYQDKKRLRSKLREINGNKNDEFTRKLGLKPA